MGAAPNLADKHDGKGHAADHGGGHAGGHGDHHAAEGLVDIHGGHGGGGHAQHEEGEQWLISYADLMTLLVGFFVILLSFSQVDQEKMDGLRKEMTKTFGGTYEQPFSEMSNRIRDQLNKLGLGNQVVVKQTDTGVEIAFLGTVFFNLGSADMKENGKAILDQVIPIIKNESAEFNIIIEGHTDDVPVSGNGFFRNNWELSSLRACRVLQVFFDFGSFSKEHMTAVGYGDSKPAVPNRDPNGVAIPANQSQNRRVVIRLIKRSEPALGGPAKAEGASSEAVAAGSGVAAPKPAPGEEHSGESTPSPSTKSEAPPPVSAEAPAH